MNHATSHNQRTLPRRNVATRALPLLARVTAIAFVAPLLLAVPAMAQEAPTIDSADPMAGPPGTQVRLNGTGLSDVEAVYFGFYEEDDLVEAEFAAHSDTVLYFQIPEIEVGQYDVVVVNSVGEEASACCIEVTGDDVTDPDDTGDEGEAEPDATDASCTVADQNVQCNDFGRIAMPSQRDIRGEEIQITTAIRIDYDFQAQGARWVMFSVRNVTADGNNPVTVTVNSFSTPHGDIITMKEEDDKPYETNLWVDIIDIPVGEPITMDLTVGATDRGAFRLETLVMVFDRGYAPLKDEDGLDVSLFSFTLLGVNKATSAEPAGGIGRVGNLPSPGFVLGTTVLLGVIAIASRRWSA